MRRKEKERGEIDKARDLFVEAEFFNVEFSALKCTDSFVSTMHKRCLLWAVYARDNLR